MKLLRLVLPCCGLLFVGCESSETIYDDQPNGSRQGVPMIKMMNNVAIDNGVIAQHTLFPHHFVVNSAKLNELGRRDLGILARHFLTAPGQLNVRRGNTSETLYEARVANVRNRMIDYGVDAERLKVGDGLPGGNGMGSEFVLNVLDVEFDGSGSGSGSGFPTMTTTPKKGANNNAGSR